MNKIERKIFEGSIKERVKQGFTSLHREHTVHRITFIHFIKIVTRTVYGIKSADTTGEVGPGALPYKFKIL